MWLKGESGQTLCSELQQAERADASEASARSRKRAVVYLKLASRQTRKPHITQTKDCTYHRQQTVHKTYEIWVLGTADRCARGGRGEGGPGLKPKGNEKGSREIGHYAFILLKRSECPQVRQTATEARRTVSQWRYPRGRRHRYLQCASGLSAGDSSI